MTRSRVLAALAVMTFAVVACEDDKLNEVGPTGRTSFNKYVAMGTSVSMGVRNGFNAVTAETQIGAWPSLLAKQANASNNFRLPLFNPGGCLSPNVAPLSLGINLAGRPQASPLQPDTICSGLVAGTALPTNNVAITGHTVLAAYTQTPESAAVKVSDVPRRKITPLVLPPQKTQVTAMTSQKPSFVSVEFGANDILSIVSGVAIVGATITPPVAFDTIYTKIIDSVKSTGAKAVIMGLPTSIDSAVALRKGSEIHADSAAFTGFNITILSDCRTTNANNYIFVPARVFAALGQARSSASRVPFSCADAGPGVVDYSLTPADVALANSTIASYNARMQALATANGYAYATMDPWFSNAKPRFSIVALVTTTAPYGNWFGLDGVHPTQAGQIALANSAIAAINSTYRFTIPALPTP